MPVGQSITAAAAPLLRGINWWYDHERDGRALRIALLLFVVAWTVFGIVAYASIDLHSDPLEAYAWGRHPTGGTYKHPPLTAWVPALWFAIFPAADWSFQLLAVANAALALYFVDLIARRYLSGDKRLLVLLLLLLMPFYQFHGQRFNANTVLLSTWPIATYCFLRAFESRGVLWSIAAGAMAGVAMLGKYYSIYLVGAFVVAALAHPARWTYLKSPSPWISAAVGLLVLSPHLAWLRTAPATPFDYAYSVHGKTTTAQAIEAAGGYLIGAIGYVAIPVIAYLLAVRPDRRTLRDALWPADPDRRMLVLLLAGMVLLPVLTAPLIGLEITSLWSMSAWFLLPIVLLAPASAILPRFRAVHLALAVVLITAGVLLASPVLAWRNHFHDKDDRAYFRPVADEVARQWRAATDQPLRIVTSTIDLAAALTFYHPDHPDSVPVLALRLAPWVTAERLAREGFLAVCPITNNDCLEMAIRRSASEPGARRSEFDAARVFLGDPGKPQRFVAVVVPPKPRTLP